MPQTPDALVVRGWCVLALDALGRAREEIDAINVYPVADSDTGTNLYLTVESAARAVEATFTAHEAAGSQEGPSLAESVRAVAHGALIGARGNSGTILAQLLRGMAQVLAGDGELSHEPAPQASAARARRLKRALSHAAASGYRAVAHPVEGTVLSVATAAAKAAEAAADDCAAVARAAYDGACLALERTPEQLAVLGRAGVVDAGGRGLVAVLGALAEAVSGRTVTPYPRHHSGTSATGRRTATPDPHAPGTSSSASSGTSSSGTSVSSATSATTLNASAASEPAALDATPVPEATTPGPPAPSHLTPDASPDDPCVAHEPSGSPAFEVIYLLEAEDDAQVDRLRTRLDALGDSLVVVGGDGLWNVHVHVDDAGAAVEAGVEAGRPYRIRITHFGTEDAHSAGFVPPPRERAQRAIVAVVPGEGLAALYAEAGATPVLARPGEPPASGELVEAVRRAHAREVVLMPNDADLRHTAAAAAEQARTEGVRAALIPTRSAVQGIAALAVHEPERRFDEDVVAMTAAAGATRCGELAVAERESWTMAGICQRGDMLGLIDGDVAVIGAELPETARAVLDRMLSAGGEMVTLVLGEEVPDTLAATLETHVRETYLAVDTVVYRGGRNSALLLIGVE